jgi:hypothetical protein
VNTSGARAGDAWPPLELQTLTLDNVESFLSAITFAGRYLMNLLSRSVVLACVLASASCRNALDSDQSSVVGSYVLDSVSGRGPTVGSMLLLPSGQVERKVRYRQPDGSLSNEYVALGTFHLTEASSLEIGLREDGGTSSYVWKPLAALRDGMLSLEYPDPADGPNIVERYKRL